MVSSRSLRSGLRTAFLTMSTGRTSFLTMSTRRAWPDRVKWIRAGGKEALLRREALDDSWAREGCTHVYLERRFMVTTFDFLGWGVFVDRGETKATRGPSRSRLVALGSREPEAVTLGEDRGTAQRQQGQPTGPVQCVRLSRATGASGGLRDKGRGNGHLRSRSTARAELQPTHPQPGRVRGRAYAFIEPFE